MSSLERGKEPDLTLRLLEPGGTSQAYSPVICLFEYRLFRGSEFCLYSSYILFSHTFYFFFFLTLAKTTIAIFNGFISAIDEDTPTEIGNADFVLS